MLGRGTGTDHEEIGLVHVARVPNLARDHPQALVATEEPTTDAVDPAKGLNAVAHVDAHLRALVHERDGGFAIARVQPLEEELHRVDCTHAAEFTPLLGSPAGRARPIGGERTSGVFSVL